MEYLKEGDLSKKNTGSLNFGYARVQASGEFKVNHCKLHASTVSFPRRIRAKCFITGTKVLTMKSFLDSDSGG